MEGSLQAVNVETSPLPSFRVGALLASAPNEKRAWAERFVIAGDSKAIFSTARFELSYRTVSAWIFNQLHSRKRMVSSGNGKPRLCIESKIVSTN